MVFDMENISTCTVGNDKISLSAAIIITGNH